MKLEKGILNKKELPVEVQDLGERRVLFTISREVVDRDGDILRANGIDLTNYSKNMVFLGFHNSRDFPLGKVEKVWVEGDRVKSIVYFPTVEELSSNPEQASEKAKLVDFTYHCYKTGMLNAVSVGFIPLEWIETEKGFDILKWELLEFSAVAVPANQDAIAEAVKSFGDEFAKGLITQKTEKENILEKLASCEKLLKECNATLKACGAELTKAKENLVELPDVPKVELPDFDN